MPDSTPEGHDIRIARLEEENRYLRAGFEDVRQSLKEMAQAVTELAKEAAQREADRDTFRRIFTQLEADREEFSRLWRRTDEMIEKSADTEKKRLEAELAAKGTALHEVAKSGLYILTGLVLALICYKLGLK